MEKEEFKCFRQRLQRTQETMAQLLGISVKAVRSYEQGWRQIPNYVERQMLFLVTLKENAHQCPTPCWEVMGCPDERKTKCPAWEFQAGNLCWFINGTIREGVVQENWGDKIDTCRNCKVFPLVPPDPKGWPCRQSYLKSSP